MMGRTAHGLYSVGGHILSTQHQVGSHKGHLGSEVEIGSSNKTGSGNLGDQGIILDLYICISHFIAYGGLAQDCGIFSAMEK